MYPQTQMNDMLNLMPPNEATVQDDAVPVFVAIRLKPQQSNAEGRSIILNSKHSNEISIVGPDIPQEKFKFEHVLGENASQAQVYDKVFAPFFTVICDGFDLFVIMYGGSGCGKTYTLFGPQTARTELEDGLIPRFVRQVFNENYHQFETKIKVSSFEVTNHDISDLLVHGRRRQSLYVGDQRNLTSATEIECKSFGDVMSQYDSSLTVRNMRDDLEFLEAGHHFFRVKIEQKVENKLKTSSVTFVDLAPSDCMLRSTNGQFNDVNRGLLSFNRLISAFGDPRCNQGTAHMQLIVQESSLTQQLQNAFRGKALTLMFCCVSPSQKDSEETFSTLRLAKIASNICNYPVENIQDHIDPEEEISFINQPKANMMPDLINPDHLRLNYLYHQQMQHMMQQQMVSNYLMMLNQQENHQNVQASPISPFMPINSPGSTLELKSPGAQPFLNETNLQLNLPNEPSKVVSDEGSKNVKKDRKNSLATLQKTLDSILEESENGSSTRKTSSVSTLASFTEDFEDSSEDEEDDEEEENDTNDDDFDSDCSIMSNEEIGEEQEAESIMNQIERSVKERVELEQEQILDDLLEQVWMAEKPCNIIVIEQKEHDLKQADQDLSYLQDQITAISKLLKVKAQVIDEATKSSIEMKKAKGILESKLNSLEEQDSQIKKELKSAHRRLRKAENEKSSKSHQYHNKIEELRTELSKVRQSKDQMDSCLKSVMSPTKESKNAVGISVSDAKSAKISYENLEREKAKLEERLSQELERKLKLEEEVVKLTSTAPQSTMIHAGAFSKSFVSIKDVQDGSVKSRFDDLREYKNKLVEELVFEPNGSASSLAYHREGQRKRKPRCEGCQKAHDEGRDHQDRCKRIEEIDLLMEAIDHIFDEYNAKQLGHDFELASVNDPDEMAFLKRNLDKMCPKEVKSLVHYSFGKIMDLRMRGRDLDFDFQASEKLNHRFRIAYDRQYRNHQLDKEEFKKLIVKQQQEYVTNINKLMVENQKKERHIKRIEESRDKYKEYYLTHRDIKRNEEPSDDDDNANEIKSYSKTAKTINNESKKVTFERKGNNKIFIKKPSSDTMPDHRKSSKKHK